MNPEAEDRGRFDSTLGRALLALIPLSVAIIIGLPTLYYPFGRDHGNYSYAAWTLLDGARPYNDIFIFKPPATAWIHELALSLFGINMWGIRVFDLGWTALTALAVTGVAGALFRRRTLAVLSGVSVALLYWNVDFWNIAQTDGWATLPCTLAMLGVLIGTRQLHHRQSIGIALLVFAGLAASFAVSLKYTAGLIALPMLCAIALGAARHGARASQAILWVALGGIAGLGCTAGWLWISGGWDAFIDVQTNLIPSYVDKTAKARTVWSGLTRAFQFNGHKWDVAILWYTPIIALIPALLGVRKSEHLGLTSLTLVVWWGASAAAVISQGQYFDYHYLALLAPAAILAGMALDWSVRWIRLGGLRAAVLTLALGAAMLLGPYRAPAVDSVRIVTGDMTWEHYLRSRSQYRYRDYNLGDQLDLVQHLSANTAADDRVFIWGFDPAIHVWAQRRGVTRFLYNYPFRVAWDSVDYRDELMHGLTATPPEWVVVAAKDATYGVTGDRRDSAQLLRAMPRLNTWLTANYEPAQRFGCTRSGTNCRYTLYAPLPPK